MQSLLESIDVQSLNLIFAKSAIIKIINFSVSLILLSLRYMTLVIDITDGCDLSNKARHEFLVKNNRVMPFFLQ